MALVSFSLAAALLASVARTTVGSSTGVSAPVRYPVLLIPLHVGPLWLVSPVLSRWWNDDNRWTLVATGMTTVCVLLLVQQVAGGQAAVTWSTPTWTRHGES